MNVDLVDVADVKILIADDSQVYRHLIKQALSGHGYQLIVAANGSDCWRLFEEHKPEIVITDWNMPGFEGPELCRRIRKSSRKSYSYVILLTSQSDKKHVVEGLAAGADDYLTKPFDEGEMLARIAVGHRIIALQRQIELKNARLEELALTDQLTGLPNRRAIEQWAVREISAAERHNYSLWVAMADLDHFKDVNDAFGHNVGDLVIRGFADVLRTNTRQSNMCARFGGEEFLMILTHADLNNTIIALDRVRGEFERRRFMTRSGVVEATASFGIAGFECGVAMGFEELLSRADRALYRAKEAGRNRIMHQ